jgi:hypothetical protein
LLLSVGGKMLLSQPLLYRQVRGDYNEFAQTERNAAHRAVSREMGKTPLRCGAISRGASFALDSRQPA